MDLLGPDAGVDQVAIPVPHLDFVGVDVVVSFQALNERLAVLGCEPEAGFQGRSILLFARVVALCRMAALIDFQDEIVRDACDRHVQRAEMKGF